MGKVVSAGVVGVMIAHLGPRACFMIIAALPLLITCSSLVMREDRVGGWCCGQSERLLEYRHATCRAGLVARITLSMLSCFSGHKDQPCRTAVSVLAEKLGLLKRTCSDKYLLMPAIFIFLWQVGPVRLFCPFFLRGSSLI